MKLIYNSHGGHYSPTVVRESGFFCVPVFALSFKGKYNNSKFKI